MNSTALNVIARPLLIACIAAVAACASQPARLPSDNKAGSAKEVLTAGNKRFVAGGMHAHTWQDERVIQTGTFGQSPSIGVLTCADSRLPAEIIFDQGVGDLFVIRVAGNVSTPTGVGSLEYGVAALGVHSIIVLGHTKCGAVDATVAGKPLPGSMGTFTALIAPALTGKPDGLNAATEANTRWQAKQLLVESELLRKAVADGKLTMLMAIYDVETGKVRFLD